MIIVDFQHLSYRNLHTCIYSCKPKKIDGKFITEDFIGLYFHQMLTSLNKIERDFGDEYGDILVALDGFHNWRKELIQDFYKADRSKARAESEINFKEFFEYQNLFEEFLKGFVRVIRVDKAEADDIGFVLSHWLQEKTLLITSDKDWKQHLIGNYNVDLYDPLKSKYLLNSPQIQDELKLFRAKHILLGDKSDGIPNVMYQIELHPDFLNYLNELKLDIKTPTELENFIQQNGNEIIENYKGEIYKTPRFGEKAAEKLINDPTEFIQKKVKDKKKFYKNFRLNRQLVDLRKIPKEIKKEIIETFENTKINKVDANFIKKFNLDRCYHYKIGGKVIEDYVNNFNDEFSDLGDLF
jgi:5'-3' exonuclease